MDRLLSPADVVTMGAVSYCVGCFAFLLLATLSTAPVEHLALVYFGGLSASFLYTGGPGLKYIAFGDVAVVLTFGPVTVLFAYISQVSATLALLNMCIILNADFAYGTLSSLLQIEMRN